MSLTSYRAAPPRGKDVWTGGHVLLGILTIAHGCPLVEEVVYTKVFLVASEVWQIELTMYYSSYIIIPIKNYPLALSPELRSNSRGIRASLRLAALQSNAWMALGLRRDRL